MLKMVLFNNGEKDLYGAWYFCDVCNEKIEKTSEGHYYWLVDIDDFSKCNGDNHVHKGMCSRRMVAPRGKKAMFLNLDEVHREIDYPI